MNVILKIRRFNPETDDAPYYKQYTVQAAPSDRLLDLLLHVKNFLDPTLAFRRSCAHGVCGSDAMRINGVEGLACKTLVKDVVDENNSTVTLEPLNVMAVQRDLMVDFDEFFARYRAVKPFLINDAPVAGGERPQRPAEREKIDDPTKCILCAACFSSCPVEESKNPRFIGPAAVVQAARFVFDSRDAGFADRLSVLDHGDGVWACENHFHCTKVCPRGIKVTKNINLVKNEIKKRKAPG